MPHTMIKQGLKALSQKKPVILFDDLSKQPSGYLCLTAENATGKQVSQLVNIGRGILLAAIEESTALQMGLAALGDSSTDPFPLGIGVEARHNITTGISAIERAETLRAISSQAFPEYPAGKAPDNKIIIAPGHIFPLIGKDGGLLVKTGVAEAVLDLLNIAKVKPVGLVSHMLSKEGGHSSLQEIEAISLDYNMPIVNMSSIINYRLSTEPLIKRVATAKLPIENFGDFQAHCYASTHDRGEHLVLTKGVITATDPPTPILVRMHSERKLGDLFFNSRQTGREKLFTALKRIHEEGQGALVYIRKNKARILSEQLGSFADSTREDLEQQADSNSVSSLANKSMELKELGIGAQMLLDLNIRSLKLLTSSIKTTPDLSAFSLKIHEQILLN